MKPSVRDTRSLNKIATDLRKRASGGQVSIGSSLSHEQIKFNIVNYRELFLRRTINKNGLDYHAEQSLGCMELELVDESECCGGYDTGCKILRTKNKIPNTIRFNNKPGITFIGSVDGKNKYEQRDPFTSKWLTEGEFTGKQIRTYILNNYVYVLNSLALEVIAVRGIFSDPTELKNFNTCEGDPCYTDDSEFPVPGDLLRDIENAVFNEVIQPIISTPEDRKADLQESNQTKRQE